MIFSKFHDKTEICGHVAHVLWSRMLGNNDFDHYFCIESNHKSTGCLEINLGPPEVDGVWGIFLEIPGFIAKINENP